MGKKVKIQLELDDRTLDAQAKQVSTRLKGQLSGAVKIDTKQAQKDLQEATKYAQIYKQEAQSIQQLMNKRAYFPNEAEQIKKAISQLKEYHDQRKTLLKIEEGAREKLLPRTDAAKKSDRHIAGYRKEIAECEAKLQTLLKLEQEIGAGKNLDKLFVEATNKATYLTNQVNNLKKVLEGSKQLSDTTKTQTKAQQQAAQAQQQTTKASQQQLQAEKQITAEKQKQKQYDWESARKTAQQKWNAKAQQETEKLSKELHALDRQATTPPFMTKKDVDKRFSGRTDQQIIQEAQTELNELAHSVRSFTSDIKIAEQQVRDAQQSLNKLDPQKNPKVYAKANNEYVSAQNMLSGLREAKAQAEAQLQMGSRILGRKLENVSWAQKMQQKNAAALKENPTDKKLLEVKKTLAQKYQAYIKDLDTSHKEFILSGSKYTPQYVEKQKRLATLKDQQEVNNWKPSAEQLKVLRERAAKIKAENQAANQKTTTEKQPVVKDNLQELKNRREELIAEGKERREILDQLKKAVKDPNVAKSPEIKKITEDALKETEQQAIQLRAELKRLNAEIEKTTQKISGSATKTTPGTSTTEKHTAEEKKQQGAIEKEQVKNAEKREKVEERITSNRQKSARELEVEKAQQMDAYVPGITKFPNLEIAPENKNIPESKKEEQKVNTEELQKAANDVVKVGEKAAEATQKVADAMLNNTKQAETQKPKLAELANYKSGGVTSKRAKEGLDISAHLLSKLKNYNPLDYSSTLSYKSAGKQTSNFVQQAQKSLEYIKQNFGALPKEQQTAFVQNSRSYERELANIEGFSNTMQKLEAEAQKYVTLQQKQQEYIAKQQSEKQATTITAEQKPKVDISTGLEQLLSIFEEASESVRRGGEDIKTAANTLLGTTKANPNVSTGKEKEAVSEVKTPKIKEAINAGNVEASLVDLTRWLNGFKNMMVKVALGPNNKQASEKFAQQKAGMTASQLTAALQKAVTQIVNGLGRLNNAQLKNVADVINATVNKGPIDSLRNIMGLVSDVDNLANIVDKIAVANNAQTKVNAQTQAKKSTPEKTTAEVAKQTPIIQKELKKTEVAPTRKAEEATIKGVGQAMENLIKFTSQLPWEKNYQQIASAQERVMGYAPKMNDLSVEDINKVTQKLINAAKGTMKNVERFLNSIDKLFAQAEVRAQKTMLSNNTATTTQASNNTPRVSARRRKVIRSNTETDASEPKALPAATWSLGSLSDFVQKTIKAVDFDKLDNFAERLGQIAKGVDGRQLALPAGKAAPLALPNYQMQTQQQINTVLDNIEKGLVASRPTVDAAAQNAIDLALKQIAAMRDGVNAATVPLSKLNMVLRSLSGLSFRTLEDSLKNIKTIIPRLTTKFTTKGEGVATSGISAATYRTLARIRDNRPQPLALPENTRISANQRPDMREGQLTAELVKQFETLATRARRMVSASVGNIKTDSLAKINTNEAVSGRATALEGKNLAQTASLAQLEKMQKALDSIDFSNVLEGLKKMQQTIDSFKASTVNNGGASNVPGGGELQDVPKMSAWTRFMETIQTFFKGGNKTPTPTETSKGSSTDVTMADMQAFKNSINSVIGAMEAMKKELVATGAETKKEVTAAVNDITGDLKKLKSLAAKSDAEAVRAATATTKGSVASGELIDLTSVQQLINNLSSTLSAGAARAQERVRTSKETINPDLKGMAALKEHIKGASAAMAEFKQKTLEAAHEAAKLKRHYKEVGRVVQGILISRLFYSGLRAISAQISAVKELVVQYEQAHVAMSVLLKDQERASELMVRLSELAAKTQLTNQTADEGARMLLAYGFQAENVISIMQDLSDATAATGDPTTFIRIARALGQIRTKGRLATQEVLQLTEVGIPAYDILREELQLSTAQMKNLGRAGIPAEAAIRALLNGMEKRFGGAAEAMSQTMSGLWSTIKDNSLFVFKEMIAGAAAGFREILSKVAKFSSDMYQTLLSSGIGGVFEQLVPKSFQGILRTLVANLHMLLQVILMLQQALHPFVNSTLKGFVYALNVLLPVINAATYYIAMFTGWISRSAPFLERFAQFVAITATAFIAWRVIGGVISLVIGLVKSLGLLVGAIQAVIQAKSLWILFTAENIGSLLSLVKVIGLVIAAVLALTGVFDGLFKKVGNFFTKKFKISPSSYLQPIQKATDAMEKFDDAYSSDALDKWTEDVKNAAEEAEKDLNNLQSFDEVFTIDEPKDASSSGDTDDDPFADLGMMTNPGAFTGFDFGTVNWDDFFNMGDFDSNLDGISSSLDEIFDKKPSEIVKGLGKKLMQPFTELGEFLANDFQPGDFRWEKILNSEGLGIAVDGLYTILQGLQNIVVGVFQIIYGLFTGDWNALLDGVKNVILGVIELFVGLIEVVGGIFLGLVELVTKPFISLFNWLAEHTSGWWSVFFQSLSVAFQGILTFFEGIIGGIVDIFTGLVDIVAGIFTSDWERVKEGLRNAGLGLLEIISGIVGGIAEFLGGILVAIVSLWEGVMGVLATFAKWLWDVFFNAVQAVINAILEVFAKLFEWLASKASGAWKDIFNGMAAIFRGFQNIVSGIITALKGTFKGIIDFLVGVFTLDWKRCWNGIKEFFGGIAQGLGQIVEGIKRIFSGLVDFIVGVFKGITNTIVSVLNFLIRSLNKINFKVPDWVPGIGGTNFGFHIPEIPKLAKGGLIRKNTLAELGEQGRREAVLPLEDSRAMKQIAESIVSQMGTPNTNTGTSGDVNLQVGVLVADDRSLRKLEQMLQEVRNSGRR